MIRYLILFLLLCSTAGAQEVPGVTAKSYIVLDETGSVVLAHNEKVPRSIASITKLLVAEQLAPVMRPEVLVTIEKDDLATRWSHLKPNTEITEQQLLELALIPSNNQAIYALTRAHGMADTISLVNTTAQARGLSSITIAEPSGLDPNNQASAEDLARFAQLVAGQPVAKVTIETSTSYGGWHSTNPYLGKPGWNFALSKTGYIHQAGGCVVSVVEVGHRYLTIVILGSKTVKERWVDLSRIRSYLSSTDEYWHLGPTVKLVKRIHHHHRRK